MAAMLSRSRETRETRITSVIAVSIIVLMPRISEAPSIRMSK